MHPVKIPRSCALALLLLIGAGCGGERGSGLPLQPTTGTNAPQARAYLEQLLTVMEQNSIKRLTIDPRNRFLTPPPRSEGRSNSSVMAIAHTVRPRAR